MVRGNRKYFRGQAVDTLRISTGSLRGETRDVMWEIAKKKTSLYKSMTSQ